jgi:hypothetical protein
MDMQRLEKIRWSWLVFIQSDSMKNSHAMSMKYQCLLASTSADQHTFSCIAMSQWDKLVPTRQPDQCHHRISSLRPSTSDRTGVIVAGAPPAS